MTEPRNLNPITQKLDNAEFDHVLEALRGQPGNSLFRWAAAPLPALMNLLEMLPSTDGYLFEDLVPSAAGMVRDNKLGLRFHSQMRSKDVEGEWVFCDDAEHRQRVHSGEKSRFDNELRALCERLLDDQYRLFVVKANAGLTTEALISVENLLKRHCNDAFVLVVVNEQPEPGQLLWQTPNCVLGSVRSLAPYASLEQIDLNSWQSLLDQLAVDPAIRASLHDADLDNRFLDWNTSLTLDQKEEELYRLLGTLSSIEKLPALMKELCAVDSDYHRYLGGEILSYLCASETEHADVMQAPESLAQDFDNRYLRLMALHSNIDVVSAKLFNARGESLYGRFGKSFVRYSRIDGSMENARGLLEYFASIKQQIVPVSPMCDATFFETSLPIDSPPGVFAQAGGTQPTLLNVILEKPRPRQFNRLSEFDDTDRAENLWLEPRREDTIDGIKFHLVNEACISWQPSTIVFKDMDTYRYATSTSDMYHHSRVAGRVGLGKGKSRVDEAYFLPRFGPPENHYHTLVDKLPTLYGYKLLGLQCPLIAAYRPNETMYQIMDLMGIDRERVHVDLWTDVTAERAIIPTPARLRPLFLDFCATLPRGKSPLGARIYISRGDVSGRGMQNEGDVEALLQQHGFDIVRMEEHDFESQRAICANASIIVAPHGAGMTNMIFAPPGCSIVELIPERYMVRFFWQLATDCGHRYSVLAGQMNEHAPNEGPIGKSLSWSTDLQALQRLVSDLDRPRLRQSA